MDVPRRHRRSQAALMSLALDRRLPLQRQLTAQLREALLAGRLAPGRRLPSTRALAVDLGCSRNTVIGAFEQLIAEGYLQCRSGSGTYVSPVLPEHLLASVPAAPAVVPGGPPAGPPAAHPEARPFAPGVPDLDLFPFDVWGRLMGRIWRRPSRDLLLPGAPAGHLPLRQAIAGYLAAVRSVVCGPEQVFITAGAQPALDLAARVLLRPGDGVWLEEPGYPGLRGPLEAAGAHLLPRPLDAEGLQFDSASLAARLAVVAPSHQYPLGTTMSLARRLALLDWAQDRKAWVVEDDYDSEYRYAGRPLAALQGLDAARGGARVLYIGTFSKVLFPAIRVGFLVVPPDLVAAVTAARAALDAYPSAVVQPVLSAFMEEGHFAAHVRRMRTVYARRRDALLAAGARHLTGLLQLDPGEAGLHLFARLAPDLAKRMDDREAERRAAAAGLAPRALGHFFLGAPKASYPDRPPPQGLLLGFAALSEAGDRGRDEADSRTRS